MEVDGCWIPSDHPRYKSLMSRERIVAGLRKGIVVPQGLMAHGRGEMFDYLLGEESSSAALAAERAAAALLLLAERPMISVNGNVAALCPELVVRLARTTGAGIEVNLFHWTEERARRIREVLEDCGAREVLAEGPDAVLEGVDHPRGRCHSKGVSVADVVLVPLEDGDRTLALAKTGKRVISIDLNPLSRTTLSATISIVDELTRAMTKICGAVEELSADRARASKVLASYDNLSALRSTYAIIRDRLDSLIRD